MKVMLMSKKTDLHGFVTFVLNQKGGTKFVVEESANADGFEAFKKTLEAKAYSSGCDIKKVEVTRSGDYRAKLIKLQF